jgi:hypothetical protein
MAHIRSHFVIRDLRDQRRNHNYEFRFAEDEIFRAHDHAVSLLVSWRSRITIANSVLFTVFDAIARGYGTSSAIVHVRRTCTDLPQPAILPACCSLVRSEPGYHVYLITESAPSVIISLYSQTAVRARWIICFTSQESALPSWHEGSWDFDYKTFVFASKMRLVLVIIDSDDDCCFILLPAGSEEREVVKSLIRDGVAVRE